MPSGFLNPHPGPAQPLFGDDEIAQQRAFFAAHPALRATPLRSLPELARLTGVATLMAKDETARFGLNAFKSTGALLAIATLRDRGQVRAGDTLVCASEGNHGRAVARAARDAGCRAIVYLGEQVGPARASAIQSEGAEVIRVAGTYDTAVRTMSDDARRNGWIVVSDTSGAGEDDTIPRLIMLGYTRLMDEAETEWPARPQLIVVPGGVGGLTAAVASWAQWRFHDERPRVVCVEPTSAACLQASARAGQPVVVPGPFDTEMGGLRCGEVSHCAFPAVQSIVDAFVAIEDEWAFEAMRHLASAGVQAGPSGAAAVGALLALARDPSLLEVRRALPLQNGAHVLVVVSEGVTDPDLFAQVVERPTSEHPGR